ncbi:HAD family hydrolase [Carboxydochorda subterranea]|uniref:HAD family hydrolase n=1 Tax=Carboxydichorda subterranea TaxID=3109565 RepID=A0ABZ1BXG0_9FIRM|nr:HAD family hydrolase [Limnochorda sp. L945t]WRP17361.1 HAD family hydrolase [Limnochorda sp. L945t]
MPSATAPVQAVLFDLDGTLNGIDMERFLPLYFRALGEYVGHLIEPQRLAREVWKATEALLQDGSMELSNAEKFRRLFLPDQGELRDRLYPWFDRFYAERFGLLRQHAPVTPLARQVVTAVRQMGMRVAVATNPVFPMSAIRQRLQWAGLGDVPFDWVTAMENSHACKPNLAYFREISERLEVPPERCLMVGNDRDEDMVAAKLGMHTYWVTDLPIDRGRARIEPEGQGPLASFLDWFRTRLAREASA